MELKRASRCRSRGHRFVEVGDDNGPVIVAIMSATDAGKAVVAGVEIDAFGRAGSATSRLERSTGTTASFSVIGTGER
jgi:hypothetical protein